MRATAFVGSKYSMSYAYRNLSDGLVFFSKNMVTRNPISNDPCLFPFQLIDKDVAAFGICKWQLSYQYICTNAPNHIVTVDLTQGANPPAASETYVASGHCTHNCSACNIMAPSCANNEAAPNTERYG